MQILEDNIEDYGDIAKRILALREKVQELLENREVEVREVGSGNNAALIEEIALLKTQLEGKESKIKELALTNAGPGTDTKLVQEISSLKQELLDKENDIKELSSKKVGSRNDEELVQENVLLKKQLDDREKTIKELGFKLEMFKMAKTLREGAGIGSKSEELKQMITEYIKEIDKSITSLNIE